MHLSSFYQQNYAMVTTNGVNGLLLLIHSQPCRTQFAGMPCWKNQFEANECWRDFIVSILYYTGCKPDAEIYLTASSRSQSGRKVDKISVSFQKRINSPAFLTMGSIKQQSILMGALRIYQWCNKTSHSIANDGGKNNKPIEWNWMI